MSGFLGDIQSAASFVSTLLGGSPPVVLGSVTFAELEVPEKALFGGRHQLHIHKLPGGARVIDAMGRDDLDIAWSGILEGPFASQRALEIDQLRVSGQQIALSWDLLSWTVVVSDFVAHYMRRNWIPYEIKCVVVKDNAAKTQTFHLPGVLGDIQSDINSALTTVMPIVNTVSSALGVVQSLMPIVGILAPGSRAFLSLSEGIASAQGAIGDVISISNGSLGSIISGGVGIAGILGATRAVTAISSLGAIGTAAGNLAGGLAQLGYVNRAASNLATIDPADQPYANAALIAAFNEPTNLAPGPL